VTKANPRDVRLTSRSDGVTAWTGGSGTRSKRIADSAHGAQRLALAEYAELSAQVVDVEIDHV
jgi:hypothetical protein